VQVLYVVKSIIATRSWRLR